MGKYVTPGLHDIDRQGIQPDFAMFPGFAKAEEELGACKVPANDAKEKNITDLVERGSKL